MQGALRAKRTARWRQAVRAAAASERRQRPRTSGDEGVELAQREAAGESGDRFPSPDQTACLQAGKPLSCGSRPSSGSLPVSLPLRPFVVPSAAPACVPLAASSVFADSSQAACEQVAGWTASVAPGTGDGGFLVDDGRRLVGVTRHRQLAGQDPAAAIELRPRLTALPRRQAMQLPE
jgi:hypothetical protein